MPPTSFNLLHCYPQCMQARFPFAKSLLEPIRIPVLLQLGSADDGTRSSSERLPGVMISCDDK